jgi:uncharacterized protein with HEPN domain
VSKKTEDEDQVYLDHIMECIQKIESYTVGIEHMFFEVDELYDSTLRRLQIMAESTQRLSDETKSLAPEINWRALAAFRNILVHQYPGDIYPDKVGQHVREDLPKLKIAIEKIISIRESAI